MERFLSRGVRINKKKFFLLYKSLILGGGSDPQEPPLPRSHAPTYNFEIPALLCTNLGYQEKKNLKYVPI